MVDQQRGEWKRSATSGASATAVESGQRGRRGTRRQCGRPRCVPAPCAAKAGSRRNPAGLGSGHDDEVTDHPVHRGGTYFEGPRWHEGNWWVSDFYRHTVSRVPPDGGEDVVLEVENQPSGLGWLPDGSLLVVSMKDQRLLRVAADGSVSTHADLSDVCGGHLNDMVVDASGRAFVGDFGFDLMGGGAPASASVKRVDPDGTVTVVAEDLRFPNGSVITPDGGTLIVGETGATGSPPSTSPPTAR